MRPLLLALTVLLVACGTRTNPGAADASTDVLSGDSHTTPDGRPARDGRPHDHLVLLDSRTTDTRPPDFWWWPDDLSPTDAVGPACKQPKAPSGSAVGPKGKADILFVVDSSVGLYNMQQTLITSVGSLDSALGSAADYRVGVITTDLGAFPYSAPSCTGCGDDGELQSQPFLSSCLAPASAYLQNSKGVTSYSGTLSNAFKCLASVGTNGCGFEQPLQSAAVFLTNPQSFLRADASLVLVILTNEDDCSAKNPVLYDPNATSLGPLNSFRCFQHGITCDINDPTKPGPRTNCKPATSGLLQDVTYYASLFKALKPAGRVGLVVVAGPAAPVSVSFQGGMSTLSPSCQSTLGTAAPAIRLQALVDLFGASGKLHSACASTYGPAMLDVASLVQSL